MKTKLKKYQLLICLIVSAAIVVASLFVIGFAGLNFDTTVVGGSQLEVVLPNDADSQYASNEARIVSQHQKLSLYHTTIEDKFTAGDENGEYSTRVMVLTFGDKNISEKTELEYREELAENLKIDISNISEFESVNSIIESKNIWFVVLAIAIVIVCIFVFAWIRYDVLAALSFFVANLHSLMIFFALSAITRVPIGLTSLAIMVVLNFVMSAAIVSIFEHYRKVARLHIENKETTSEMLASAIKSSLLPYAIVSGVAFIGALLLLISPVFLVRLVSLSIIIALAGCVYTATLIAPQLYAYLTDIRKASLQNRLSRNETKNKAIKKKVAKNTKKK